VLSAEERIRRSKSACSGKYVPACRFIRSVYWLRQNDREFDVLASLAETLHEGGYVCPEIVEADILNQQGRHPVVERALVGRRFVPNDVILEEGERIRILTGPNMSGKSTLIRQVALIVLMAQIGSFVPASSARLGVVDRIFTRIGAQDEIQAGQSTFMVEMVETANILHHATTSCDPDEIGRHQHL
jgi:DNA mismatch repair protein MutS